MSRSLPLQDEYWIGYDGVNPREPWVMTERPSGISGGGSNGSIHVVIHSKYNKLLQAARRWRDAHAGQDDSDVSEATQNLLNLIHEQGGRKKSTS